MRQCICQICVCGRHRCRHHTADRVPFAQDPCADSRDTTEHRERYQPFCLQPPRTQPVRPAADSGWKGGEEPAVKESTTRKDFVPLPLAKRSPFRPKDEAAGRPEGAKMAEQGTTYRHDYVPKKGPGTRRAEPRKDDGAAMRGTGKMEDQTTYGRCYTPKPLQRREKAAVKECTLTEFGRPFTGETETALSFPPHPCLKREGARPTKGTLQPGGEFRDLTTHKTDYPPKFAVPERPRKKVPQWKPGAGKFESDTTHRHDYQCPLPTEKAASCAPKPERKCLGPFQGESRYKRDFRPHRIAEREIPKWHPSFKSYKRPTAPFDGETTYRTDYEAPPEDLPPSTPKKPLKSHLTLPSGPMERLTTSMRDYGKIDCPVPTKSFKPDAKYDKPKERFAGQTITSTDYTPKKTEKLGISKARDNLQPCGGPMDDYTTTMKDFQWAAMECPATYLKLFGKDALPQYTFDRTEGGHDFFKRLKGKKAHRKEAKRNMAAKQMAPDACCECPADAILIIKKHL